MENYEIWTGEKRYCFDTIKEAYLYYLKNFATKEDFDYYKECCGKSLEDIADDEELIGYAFDNVFNEYHHLYKVTMRNDGKIIRQ